MRIRNQKQDQNLNCTIKTNLCIFSIITFYLSIFAPRQIIIKLIESRQPQTFFILSVCLLTIFSKYSNLCFSKLYINFVWIYVFPIKGKLIWATGWFLERFSLKRTRFGLLSWLYHILMTMCLFPKHSHEANPWPKWLIHLSTATNNIASSWI